MKKGFTLIELLAVIVILAIIAVIAVPIVINIIDDSKKNSSLRSAEFYLDAVDFSIASLELNSKKIKDGFYTIMKNGNLCSGKIDGNSCDGELIEVETKGKNELSGGIAIKNNQIVNSIDAVVNESIEDETLINSILSASFEIKYDEETQKNYIVVSLMAENIKSITASNIKIKYNSDKLNFVKRENGIVLDGLLNFNEDGIVKNFSNGDNNETSGVLQYYYFESDDINNVKNEDFEIFVDITPWDSTHIPKISESTSIKVNSFKLKVTNLNVYGYTPGDVNNDGILDYLDYIILKKILMGAIDKNKAADCNGDGRVDSNDIIRFPKIIVGMEEGVRSPMTGIPDYYES